MSLTLSWLDYNMVYLFIIDLYFTLLYTELEALEACYWLKAAGFPQYAQAYEGNTIQLMP